MVQMCQGHKNGGGGGFKTGLRNCGGLSVIGPIIVMGSGTIRRCGLAELSRALLKEV